MTTTEVRSGRRTHWMLPARVTSVKMVYERVIRLID